MQPTETGAAIAGKAASKITTGGAGVAIASGLSSDTVFGLTTSEWSVIGVMGGLVIAFLGFLANVYFKRQHLLIAQMSAKANQDE